MTTSIVAVLGTGPMGVGIAQVAATAGHEVRLCGRSRASLTRALSEAGDSLERLAAKGAIDVEAARCALARISVGTDLPAAAGTARLVIEAVPEDLDLKLSIFRELDRVCESTTVLASNTSAIPVGRLAEATGRAPNVVGTHFFHPVPLMRLCEVVRAPATSAETLRTAREFAESVGKTCIVVRRDDPGFVTTRLLLALFLEAVRMLESGLADARDIDLACRLGFGHALGPLATGDLAGLDVLHAAALEIHGATGLAHYQPPKLLEKLVAEGRLGRKSGAGFHPAPPPGPAPQARPATTPEESERDADGITAGSGGRR